MRRGSKPKAALRFDVAALRAAAGPKVYARGEDYHQSGQVEILSLDAARVLAQVAGTELYRVELLGTGRKIGGECACRAFTDFGFCKHLVATALTVNAMGPDAVAQAGGRFDKLRAHLRGRGVEALADMILRLAEQDSRLLRELETAASMDDGDDAAVRKQLRKAITAATRIDDYIGYRDVGDWAAGIDAVLGQVGRLIDGGRAALALGLFDHLFDRLDAAYESVDDSDGHLGGVYSHACELHLAACRAAPPDPVALAGELFSRELDSDWDFFFDAGTTYADVLGEAGQAEHRRLVQAAWERVKPRRPGTKPGAEPGGGDGYERRRLATMLERIAERDGDVEARIAIRAKTLASAFDYLGLVELCVQHGRNAEALTWAEEGLWQFERDPDIRLVRRAAELRRAAGRGADADALLWQAFEREPDLETHALLRKGARGAAAEAVDARAASILEALAGKAAKQPWDGGPADLLVELHMGAKQWARAWASARTYRCRRDTLRDLAEASEQQHPDEALAVYADLVEHAVSGSGYQEANTLIGRMGKIRAKLGRAAEHEAYRQDLLSRHKMKRNFVKLLRAGG